MPFKTIRTGARLHYEDVGKGETVVAIHGFLGTARDDLGIVIDWLKSDYHVIAPTLRGYGTSQPQPRTFPVDFYEQDADDVVALMDALEIERAHLLGYSDGGETALIAGGRYPDRFKSIAVWGAVGYFGPIVKEVAGKMYPPVWLTDEVKGRHYIPDIEAFVKEWTNAITAMVDKGGDVSLQLAGNIQCPLLMMLGNQDTLNPSIYAERFIHKVHNARLVMFDCGHPVHEEEVAAFQQTVGKFLKNGHG
jgi:valacyclovir hydrolase